MRVDFNDPCVCVDSIEDSMTRAGDWRAESLIHELRKVYFNNATKLRQDDRFRIIISILVSG